MSYDSWKTTEPDDRVPRPAGCRCHLEIGDSPCPVHPSEDDEPSDSSIERLLEDARLGDTVASVTLVEACERALADDADAEERAAAREHVRECIGRRAGRHHSVTTAPSIVEQGKKL